LHFAVRNSNLQMVRFLASNGADKEIANDTGQKPADYASAAGFPELISLVEVSQQIGKEKVMI
jgi:ankyrin repeat protein